GGGEPLGGGEAARDCEGAALPEDGGVWARREGGAGWAVGGVALKRECASASVLRHVLQKAPTPARIADLIRPLDEPALRLAGVSSASARAGWSRSSRISAG